MPFRRPGAVAILLPALPRSAAGRLSLPLVRRLKRAGLSDDLNTLHSVDCQ